MIHAGDFLLGIAGLQAGLIRPDDFAAIVRAWETGDNEPTFGQLLAQSNREDAVAQLRSHASRLARIAEQDLPGASAELREVMTSLGLNTHEAITLQPPGGFLDTPGTGDEVSEEAPGRYQFSVEHAQGGMGKILIVYDSFLARRIALKELLPPAPVSSNASTLEVRGQGPEPLAKQRQARFLYEARITGQLEHPGIVPIYELGRRADGSLYYTMRLVKGKSLRQAIRAAGNLDGRLRLLSHFTSLCQAIAFAHSRGVIHRDIKPGNVMVGEYGETVVIDWGLARMRQSSADLDGGGVVRPDIDLMKEAEADVVAVGTPAYMPPEQARGDVNAIDERSDVYSLGAVLYELLTGSAPYPDPTSASALNKLLAAPPLPVSELEPEVPEELVAICSHAMARTPADRYQTARELAADIEHFLAGRLVGVYRYKPMELLSYFVRRFKAPVIVGAVGLLGLLTTGSVAYLQVQSERNKAILESVRALEAERLAEDARQTAEQEFYLAAIASSRQFIEDFQFERAAAQLDKCAENYRHWEWGYLVYLCNRDQRTFQAHVPDTAWSIDVTPDGTHTLTAGFDKTAKGWNIATGELDFTYQSPHGAVIEVSAHPTRPLVACAEEKGYISLYDYAERKTIASWRANDDGDINCIDFSPDGKTFLSGDDKGYLRLWELESQRLIWTIDPVERGIEALSFSPDGTLIATANRSAVVSLWNATDGSWRQDFTGHTGRVTSLDFSPDGSLLASGSRDMEAIIWSVAGNAEPRHLRGHGAAVWCLRFSPDGTSLATGSSDLAIRLWDTTSWTTKRTYRGHRRQIYCMAFSPDGNLLFSGDDLGFVKQWDARAPRTVADRWTLKGHTGPINQATYSPDGTLLATAAGDWQSNNDLTTRLWDADTGNLVGVLEGHTASVRHAVFHPGGKVLATSSHDNTVRLWDVANRKPLQVLGPFETGVNVSEFNPKAPEQLLIGLRNGELVLMDWSANKVIARWKEHDGEVLSISFCPRGQWIVSSSGDDTVHVLRADTRERVKVLAHDEARIPAAVFSPDGNWLATGGHDWRVKIWNTATWEAVHELTGHTQGLFALQFSEDNRRLLSSSSDGVTIVWDLSTFREVLRFDGWVAAMRPGSLDIATGMYSGDAYIWPAFSWKLVAYPGAPETPLNERAENFKRQFWNSRLRTAAGENPL